MRVARVCKGKRRQSFNKYLYLPHLHMISTVGQVNSSVIGRVEVPQEAFVSALKLDD